MYVNTHTLCVLIAANILTLATFQKLLVSTEGIKRNISYMG